MGKRERESERDDQKIGFCLFSGGDENGGQQRLKRQITTDDAVKDVVISFTKNGNNLHQTQCPAVILFIPTENSTFFIIVGVTHRKYEGV